MFAWSPFLSVAVPHPSCHPGQISGLSIAAPHSALTPFTPPVTGEVCLINISFVAQKGNLEQIPFFCVNKGWTNSAIRNIPQEFHNKKGTVYSSILVNYSPQESLGEGSVQRISMCGRSVIYPPLFLSSTNNHCGMQAEPKSLLVLRTKRNIFWGIHTQGH